MVNKDEIRNAILAQKKAFHVSRIMADTGVSSTTIFKVLKDMIDEGVVVQDHKEGKAIFYSAVGKAGAVAKRGSNMMKLTPTERFKYMGDCVDMVIEKVQPSLLITGLAGIGKTYGVKERFHIRGMDEGRDYKFVQGHSSALGLYMKLQEYKDQTVVFDDCDTVFQDSSANILKCALDSYATRKICWASSRLPEGVDPEFEFTGSIIFVSNIDVSKIDDAVESRTMVINLQMTRDEICVYMKSILGDILPDYSMTIKKEALEFISERCNEFNQFNLRSLIKACRVRKMADKNQNDWKKMIMVLS